MCEIQGRTGSFAFYRQRIIRLRGKRSALADDDGGRYSRGMANPPSPTRLPFRTLPQALDVFAREANALGTECITLAHAGGRILATAVEAAIDSPRRNVATMDGFAVGPIPEGATGARWYVASDRIADDVIRIEEAVRIATGAPLPAGAERVIPIEHTAMSDGWLTVRDGIPTKTHIRTRGSEFERGAITLAAGRRINARALVAIAAADVGVIKVYRTPRVGVITIGTAIVDAGSARETVSAIPDSLANALALFAVEWGGGLASAPKRVADDTVALAAAVGAMGTQADVIVVVGGAAHGARDGTQRALDPLGLVLGFDGLAIRPGRPTWYGRIGALHVLGLPGNPTAAMTVARLLLAPLLARLGGGDPAVAACWEDLPLIESGSPSGPRDSFLCATAELAGSGQIGVRLLDRQRPSAQMLLASADRLVARPAAGAALPAGALVPTIRF